MRHLVRESELCAAIEIESAGTGAWHAGERADPRSRETAERRGIAIGGVARQFIAEDFARFDWIVAMDEQNRRDLLALAPDAAARAKVCLLRSFDAAAPAGAGVPDPYHGGDGGFDEVFEICEAACAGLLEHLRREQRLG